MTDDLFDSLDRLTLVRRALRLLEPDAETVDLTPLPLPELREAFATLTLLRDRLLDAFAIHNGALARLDGVPPPVEVPLSALARSDLYELLAATAFTDVSTVPPHELAILQHLLAGLHAAVTHTLARPPEASTPPSTPPPASADTPPTPGHPILLLLQTLVDLIPPFDLDAFSSDEQTLFLSLAEQLRTRLFGALSADTPRPVTHGDIAGALLLQFDPHLVPVDLTHFPLPTLRALSRIHAAYASLLRAAWSATGGPMRRVTALPGYTDEELAALDDDDSC